MTARFPVTALAILVALAFSSSGCSNPSGPPVGRVSGTVTLNGKPLPEATVEFIPEEGRPSIATTDASGHYKLSYQPTVPGALLGHHTVRITTARFPSGGEGDQPLVEARPEIVPASYNDDSTLTADVKAGDNKIDFTLEGERKKK